MGSSPSPSIKKGCIALGFQNLSKHVALSMHYVPVHQYNNGTPKWLASWYRALPDQMEDPVDSTWYLNALTLTAYITLL